MSAIEDIQTGAAVAAAKLHESVEDVGRAAQEVEMASSHWGATIGLEAVGASVRQAADQLNAARAALHHAWRLVGNVQRTVGRLRVKNELNAVLESLNQNNADFDDAVSATVEANDAVNRAKYQVMGALDGSHSMEDLVGIMNAAQNRVDDAVGLLLQASGANIDARGRISR